MERRENIKTSPRCLGLANRPDTGQDWVFQRFQVSPQELGLVALPSGVPGPLPLPSSPCQGASRAWWWHSPPGAQGDAVLMARPAAAPPRWESRGQQALGEEQEGDEARARVFLPQTSPTQLPVYFISAQPSVLP